MSLHHLRLRKRAPKPQLLDLGLPVSLPSAVDNLLDPLVHVGSPTPLTSSSPPPQSKPPAPKPSPSPSLTPSALPPSPTGKGSNNGGNGASSNDGNQSSGNGNNGGNGSSGSQGNNSGGDSNSGQSSSSNANSPSSQSGTTSSTGTSNTSSEGETSQSSQPSSNDPPSSSGSSPSSGFESGTTASQGDGINNKGGAVNSEKAPNSAIPILGEISSPNQTGSSAPQSGNDINPLTTGQPQPPTGSNSGGFSNNPPNVGNNNGGSSLSSHPSTATSSVNSPAPTTGATVKSHAGGIAAGITVSLAALTLLGFILFYLRRRHQRKQAERRITWISGFVEGNTSDMTERNSIRSSWGTPIERPTLWARTPNEDPFAYQASGATPPVLPLPVHSPLVINRPGSVSPEIPENPFSDVPTTARGSLQPLQVSSTFPIRLSLISAGSGQDPFDDVNRTPEPMNNSGQGSSEQNTNTNTAHGPSQANFPMPPSTPASVKSGLAIGSPSDLTLHKDLLATPSISFNFPDSPISPTFASQDTGPYPRRASVKYNFRASQARSDEVHLDKGEEVSVVSVYEDGWAFVQKDKDNERGLVPLNCLDLTE